MDINITNNIKNNVRNLLTHLTYAEIVTYRLPALKWGRANQFQIQSVRLLSLQLLYMATRMSSGGIYDYQAWVKLTTQRLHVLLHIHNTPLPNILTYRVFRKILEEVYLSWIMPISGWLLMELDIAAFLNTLNSEYQPTGTSSMCHLSLVLNIIISFSFNEAEYTMTISICYSNL